MKAKAIIPLVLGLAISIPLVIFGLLVSSADTRGQFLSMAALTAGIALASETARRMRNKKRATG